MASPPGESAGVAAAADAAHAAPAAHPGIVRNRVLLTLLLGALAAALGLDFVSVAPNRLVAGVGVALAELLSGAWLWLATPAFVLCMAVFLPPNRATQALVALAATVLLAGLLALAGATAAARAAGASSLVRTAMAAGCWVLLLLLWLAAADALQRARSAPAWRGLAHAAVLLPLAALLALGRLEELSLLKEHVNRQDVFAAALQRHGLLVGATLAGALLLGVPLGIGAARRERLARPLFALLNLIQTVPSIALFALLIAPLAALAALLPGWGISGVGVLPGVIALTLYALLPIVQGVAAGLRQLEPAVLQAATGMGLSRRQVFWNVELPLALPVWLAALRLTTVQVIGLAVVAALIGAGGLGALVFQGLLSGALDLVLLGVLPVVALAIGVDAGLTLLATTLHGPRP